MAYLEKQPKTTRDHLKRIEEVDNLCECFEASKIVYDWIMEKSSVDNQSRQKRNQQIERKHYTRAEKEEFIKTISQALLALPCVKKPFNQEEVKMVADIITTPEEEINFGNFRNALELFGTDYTKVVGRNFSNIPQSNWRDAMIAFSNNPRLFGIKHPFEEL